MQIRLFSNTQLIFIKKYSFPSVSPILFYNWSSACQQRIQRDDYSFGVEEKSVGIEILLQTSRLMNYHPQSQTAIPFIIIAMSSIISITDKLSYNHKTTILTLTTMFILQIVHVSSCGSLLFKTFSREKSSQMFSF